MKRILTLTSLLCLVVISLFILQNIPTKAQVTAQDELIVSGESDRLYNGDYYLNFYKNGTFEDTIILSGNAYNEEYTYSVFVYTNTDKVLAYTNDLGLVINTYDIGSFKLYYQITATINEDTTKEYLIEKNLFVLPANQSIISLLVGGNQTDSAGNYSDVTFDVKYPINLSSYQIDGLNFTNSQGYLIDEYKKLYFELISFDMDLNSIEDFNFYSNVDNNRFNVTKTSKTTFAVQLNDLSIVSSKITIIAMVGEDVFTPVTFQVAQSYQFWKVPYEIQLNGIIDECYNFSIKSDPFTDSTFYTYDWFVSSTPIEITNKEDIQNLEYKSLVNSDGLYDLGYKGQSISINPLMIYEEALDNVFYINAVCYDTMGKRVGFTSYEVSLVFEQDRFIFIGQILESINNCPELNLENINEVETLINQIETQIDTLTEEEKKYIVNYEQLLAKTKQINSVKAITEVNSFITSNDISLLGLCSLSIEQMNELLLQKERILDENKTLLNVQYTTLFKNIESYNLIKELEKMIDDMSGSHNLILDLSKAIKLYHSLSNEELQCLDEDKEKYLLGLEFNYNYGLDIEKTIQAINSIGTLDNNNDCLMKISNAKYLYDLLSNEAQTQVTNSNVLVEALYYVNDIKAINDCIIAILELENKYNFTEEELVKVEAMYFELTTEQRIKVTNYSTLQKLRKRYNQEQTPINIENLQIELSVQDKINLFLEEDSQPIIIKEISNLSTLGYTCEYIIDGSEVLHGFKEEEELYIYPYGEGTAKIICYCIINDSKTLTKTIEVNVFKEPISVLINLEKEEEGPITVYDTVMVKTQISYVINLSEEATYQWKINGIVINEVGDQFKYNFTSGDNTIEVVINDFENNISNLKATRVINVSEVIDTAYELSLNYNNEINVLKNNQNIILRAYLNNQINEDFEYSWTILDTSILKFYLDPSGNYEVAINPIKAGQTKVIVMVDVGKHESKILITEISINVIDNIETLDILYTNITPKPGETITLEATVNGISDIVNLNGNWIVTNKENINIDFTEENNKITLNELEKGEYNIIIEVADKTKELSIKCKSLALEKLLYSTVPFVVLAAMIIMAAYVVLKKRKHPLVYAKEQEEFSIRMIDDYVTSNEEVPLKDRKKKELTFIRRLITKQRNIKIKIEDFSISENIDFKTIISNVEEVLSILGAIYKLIKNDELRPSKLKKIVTRLKDSNLIFLLSLLEEKIITYESLEIEERKKESFTIGENTISKKSQEKDYKQILKDTSFIDLDDIEDEDE